MKEKMMYGVVFLFLVALAGVPALYAEENFEEVSGQAGQSFQEVSEQTEVNDSDPSAFEGDTDSMPGERAPENLPMADVPVEAGVGIDQGEASF